MADYRIENERGRQFIKETFKREFLAQEKLLEETIKGIDVLQKDSEFPKRIGSYLGLSTYALFLKGLNTYWATFILCQEGFGSEAMITVRSLFNLVVNLLWISKEDADERAERFLAFDIVYRKQRMDVIKSFNKDLPIPQNFDEIEKQYESLQKKYNLTGNPRKDKWTKKTIAEMAAEMEMKKEYQTIYSYLSQIEHSGASSLSKFVEFDGGTLKLKPGPSPDFVPIALLLNFNNFYLLLKTVNRLIPLPMDLEAEKRSFTELYKVEPSEP